MNDAAKKVSQNRQKKEKIVDELLQKVEKSQAIVFTNYQGLTHQQIEKLKKALKPLDAEYTNTKNTLLKRALGKTLDTPDTLDTFDTSLNQPTATLFMYSDVIEPLKQLTKSIKELSLPTIKFGIFEGKIISDVDLVKLSQLAPLPVLRAQLLGTMMGPVSGLHRALNWNLQKLVMTLGAIREQKT
ncbi:MAG TPA: 50S ribosomal protein L10 [Xanthomonadales bacterium]|nr:50S ribosomal protein L10 [Xanthomonadales bacterium]